LEQKQEYFMKLKNKFSDETRALYLDKWDCDICGTNGQDRGGLELHHIFARVSDSPLNSSLLCNCCHSKMGHAIEEEQRLLRSTINYLSSNGYVLNDSDGEFLDMLARQGRLNGFFL
jgi:hypothetical protein